MTKYADAGCKGNVVFNGDMTTVRPIKPARLANMYILSDLDPFRILVPS